MSQSSGEPTRKAIKWEEELTDRERGRVVITLALEKSAMEEELDRFRQ